MISIPAGSNNPVVTAGVGSSWKNTGGDIDDACNCASNSDVYSGSKAACEILTQSYIKSFYSKKNHCKIATARSGNCIGGGDWTKDRIIKDCAESFLFNKNLVIRSPKASRAKTTNFACIA